MIWTHQIRVCLVVICTSLSCSCTLFENTSNPAPPEAGTSCPVNGEVYQKLVCTEGTWLEDSGTTTTTDGVSASTGAYPAAGALKSETYELSGELAPSVGAHNAESATYELELTPVLSTSK